MMPRRLIEQPKITVKRGNHRFTVRVFKVTEAKPEPPPMWTVEQKQAFDRGCGKNG